MKRLTATLVLIAALMTPIVGAQPPDREPSRPDSPASDAWKAGPEDGGRRHRMPPGVEDEMMGPGGPEGEMPRRIMKIGARIREEAERLRRSAENIERDEKELAEPPKGDEAPNPERTQRRTRMLELKKELLTLEKAEMVDRVRRESGRMREGIAERSAKMEADGHTPPPMMVGLMSEALDRLGRLEKVTTVEEISEILSEPMMGLPGEGTELATERLRKEQEILRKRLDAIEQRMENVRQFAPPAGGPPPEGQPRRQGAPGRRTAPGEQTPPPPTME